MIFNLPDNGSEPENITDNMNDLLIGTKGEKVIIYVESDSLPQLYIIANTIEDSISYLNEYIKSDLVGNIEFVNYNRTNNNDENLDVFIPKINLEKTHSLITLTISFSHSSIFGIIIRTMNDPLRFIPNIIHQIHQKLMNLEKQNNLEVNKCLASISKK